MSYICPRNTLGERKPPPKKKKKRKITNASYILCDNDGVRRKRDTYSAFLFQGEKMTANYEGLSDDEFTYEENASCDNASEEDDDDVETLSAAIRMEVSNIFFPYLPFLLSSSVYPKFDSTARKNGYQ